MPRPSEAPHQTLHFLQAGGVSYTPVAFSPKPSWVAWSPWALRSSLGCSSGRSGLPRPSSGPGPFQRTIVSMQGKIPLPRVQVSKELLGPLMSLAWALRSRCSCLACFPPRCVLFLTPELPRIVFPQQMPGNGEERNRALFPLGDELGGTGSVRLPPLHTHLPPTPTQEAGSGVLQGLRPSPRG